jgi:hypothetical protein
VQRAKKSQRSRRKSPKEKHRNNHRRETEKSRAPIKKVKRKLKARLRSRLEKPQAKLKNALKTNNTAAWRRPLSNRTRKRSEAPIEAKKKKGKTNLLSGKGGTTKRGRRERMKSGRTKRSPVRSHERRNHQPGSRERIRQLTGISIFN